MPSTEGQDDSLGKSCYAENMQKGFAHLLVIILVIGIVVLAAVGILFWRKSLPIPITQKACTQEAKICPDGSSVGRTGPDCQFAACPSVKPTQTPVASSSADILVWKTYTGENYSFQYPADWILNDNSGYLESVNVENPKKTVNLLISNGQYPYGFGAEQDVVINNLAIFVDGKTYQVKELVTAGKKAYVDFKLDNQDDYHILFGTGYPAASDTNYSIEDYQNSKPIILKILSTLKFN